MLFFIWFQNVWFTKQQQRWIQCWQFSLYGRICATNWMVRQFIIIIIKQPLEFLHRQWQCQHRSTFKGSKRGKTFFRVKILKESTVLNILYRKKCSWYLLCLKGTNWMGAWGERNFLAIVITLPPSGEVTDQREV